MKIATNILINISEAENQIVADFNAKLDELGFDGVKAIEAETDSNGDTFVTFVDDENNDMEILFTYDDDEGATALILDEFDDDPESEDEVDVVDLNALEPKITNGSIDMSDLSWLNDSAIQAILQAGDFMDNDELDERQTVVIRNGKKVKVALVRRKRKKVRTSKQKQGAKKAARKRKTKQGAINRKRKKSLKLRKRSNLKTNKNKRLKVAGGS